MKARSHAKELAALARRIDKIQFPHPRYFTDKEQRFFRAYEALINWELQLLRSANPTEPTQNVSRVMFAFKQALQNARYFSPLWMRFIAFLVSIDKVQEATATAEIASDIFPF
jgi:AcrR family transcriptional regulator